jgi:hypothetical protein
MKKLLLLPLLAATASAQSFKSEDVRFFTEKVRPLLDANCIKCHGGKDAKGKLKIKSGLQLISRKGITKGGEHGPAFNEAEPEKSLILHVLTYDDEDLKMPPRSKLSEEDRAIFAEWVKRGLPWTKADMNFLHEMHEEKSETTAINATTRAFWSYKPLKRPAVPKTGHATWGKNPIDAYIYTRLAQAGLKPNGPASRGELIRRASFDITGLPPTLEDVREFENDQAPNAWEKVIDRLLASPHYGEKWVRHWLDIVRYAESNGFERDSEKPHIWRYRDYVIDAFNADLPYDQFLLHQLAGDEIESPTSQSMIATGYHRLMQWDDEPADRLQHLFDNLDDDLRITAEGMLGMTIGCARCHDHKGDPISQVDYYSFMAFFRGVKQPGKGGSNVEKVGGGAEDAAYVVALKKHEEDGKRQLSDLAATEKQIGAQLIKLFPSLKGRLSENPGMEAVLPDARGGKGATWYYTFKKPANNWSAVGFRAENEKWKKGEAGFGTKGTPNSRIGTEWKTRDLWAQRTFLLESVPKSLKLSLYHDEDVELYLNGQPVLKRTGFIGDYVESDADKKFLRALQTGRNVVTVHVIQKSGGQYFDFGIKASRGDRFTIETALAMSKGKGVEPKLLGKRKRLQRQIAEHANKRPKPGTMDAQVVQEHGKTPPALHVHIRGNAHVKSDTVVSPAVPSIFGGEKLTGTPPAHGRNTSGRRLALAQWVTEPDNPRTSRVIMNRLWQHHFGRGICATPNDFGYLGERPSHPVLLDWLATELVRQKWSLKAMHKGMMMSQTYQMSSRGRPDGLAKDADNKWWWRFDVRRLTAEELRDSVLAVTGRLNTKMGGPSIYIKLSAEVLATSSTKGGKWGKSSPEDELRRSVYIKVKRSLVPPILQDFDLADTDGTCPVRFSSILPTQALAMLNSDFANREAKNFADRLRAEAPDDPKRQIELALELALARSASPREVEYGSEFIEVMMREHKLSSEDAFNRFALLVLNLNEFMFVD